MERLLPNGSVVLLKGTDHRVMIYGRAQKDKVSGKLFDYVGCYYPEGILDTERVMLFNNEDIRLVFFIGFQDFEELEYRAKLESALKKVKEEE